MQIVVGTVKVGYLYITPPFHMPMLLHHEVHIFKACMFTLYTLNLDSVHIEYGLGAFTPNASSNLHQNSYTYINK